MQKNTIAQDPTTVGQGIKTVSLRLRSTKTELEEMGEDAEGAAENVSKLRAQMLALTGVDIQFDENTYKSTYQILLEISKVWGNLNDISRASVLEQLFGKRQANIGAAILENGELLQQVYETAEDSAGSAMREQEEYAKSIQYSIDTLKAAYQDLAQTLVKSDLFKGLLGTAQTFLEVLKQIIDKVGALPPLIASITAIRSLKGKGIFNVVIDDINKGQLSLTAFGMKLKGVQEEISETNDALNKDKVSGIKKADAATKGLKLSLVATRVAATALNAAISFSVSLGVSWLAKQVDQIFDKEKKAAEEAEQLRKKEEELRKETVSNARTYNDESKELGNILSQYLKLKSTTDDLANSKDELSQLQNQIIDKYGLEADGIDLVNKELEENIRLANERQKQEDKQFLRDNKEGIQKAQDFFNSPQTTYFQFDSVFDALGKDAKKEAQVYANTINTYLREHYKDIYKNIDFNNVTGNFAVKEGINYEEQLSAINAIVDAYEYADKVRGGLKNYNSDKTLKALYEWQKTAKEYAETLRTYDEVNEKVNAWDALDNNVDTYKEYNKLLSDVAKLSAIYNDTSATMADRIDAGQKLQETIIALKEIAVQYPAVSDIIEESLSGVGLSLSGVTETVESTKETWLKSLDEAQKGILSNVDKITSAMAKLASGEAIDSKAAWDIINLDDNKLLSNISIDANGDYIFDLEQIVKLKDDILQKEIETREESIKTAKQNAKTAEENIKVAESQIYALRPKMATAYDSGDKELIAELEAEYESLKRAVESNRSSLEAYNYTIRNESLYVTELKMRLGDLPDTIDMLKAKIERMKKEVENLNKEADGLLKAQEHVIDGIIDKYEDELDILENQKGALEEQLAVLENQEDELNGIIDKYKTVSGYVQDTISKQIEGIEDNRKEIEDYYDNLIDKLKSENEEREDAIEYEKKLAALNNAKNNKVRAYDQARGWVYEANKDAIKDAQNDLDSFQNEQAIKSLEKEKEDAVKGFDERIKQLEEYSDEWKDVINSTTEAENELLATEILGSDWREKIARRDEATLTKFKTAFGEYNADLESLTKNEIANLKKSISTVDNEVVAKRKQIEVWKNYKTEITNAASDIKNGLEEYIEYLGTVTVNENSTNVQRLNNLSNFEARYKAIVSEITTKNQQIADSTERYNELADAMRKVQDVTGGGENLGASIGSSLASAIGVFASKLETFSKTFEKLFEPTANRLNKLGEADRAMDEILGFSGGGTADYTGLAMVHGSRTRAETVFNASQSKKLLNLVEAMPNFSGYLKTPASVMAKKSETNNITGTTFSIANMTVVANNPEQFEAQMKRYWQTKLTESKVY